MYRAQNNSPRKQTSSNSRSTRRKKTSRNERTSAARASSSATSNKCACGRRLLGGALPLADELARHEAVGRTVCQGALPRRARYLTRDQGDASHGGRRQDAGPLEGLAYRRRHLPATRHLHAGAEERREGEKRRGESRETRATLGGRACREARALTNSSYSGVICQRGKLSEARACVRA